MEPSSGFHGTLLCSSIAFWGTHLGGSLLLWGLLLLSGLLCTLLCTLLHAHGASELQRGGGAWRERGNRSTPDALKQCKSFHL